MYFDKYKILFCKDMFLRIRYWGMANPYLGLAITEYKMDNL